IILNGFNTKQFQPSSDNYRAIRDKLKIPNDGLIVGLVGRYHPMKDHQNFIKAVSLLLQKANNLKIHFVLCGKNVDWHNATLVQLITKLNLNKKLYLLGEQTDIASLTAAFDIATSSSSHGEGFANVIGEAMSCEVPCVVTDVGDSAWIVGETGKVVPPSNPTALAQAWQELIDLGDEGRKKLGHAARRRIIEHFSIDSIVTCYEALYSNTVRD
ncbi:MAG: glycosyltransferase, partial [Jaaginema sp. PMC 1078.18]|nr:glycosyltransferase [Jaaginema sp. PMC 1078.18]